MIIKNLPFLTSGLKMSCHFCSLITKFFIVYFERFLKGDIRKNDSFEHDFVLKYKLKLDIKTASLLKKAKLMFFDKN